MRIFKFLYFILLANIGYSQINLVPNWSFEDTISCPQFQGMSFYSYTPPWFSPTWNTPDIFHSCASDSYVGVPENILGFRYAKTGQGYAGFACGNSNVCDFISVKLNTKLKKEKKYCINFYISPASHSYFFIDKIGAYISIDSIYEPSFAYLQFNPQIENESGLIISDTINWISVSGEYVATGDEYFITIGCFRPDSLVQFAINNSNHITFYGAYYYLDDVSVYECEEETNNILNLPNAFTPNGDGVNDVFRVQGQNIKTLNGKIFNRWGQELFTWSDVNDGWDGKYNGKDAAEGTYFYVVTVEFVDGEVRNFTGSVLLTR